MNVIGRRIVEISWIIDDRLYPEPESYQKGIFWAIVSQIVRFSESITQNIYIN